MFVIGATRKKDEVSQALLTATRIGIEQEISIPNSHQRCQVSHAVPCHCRPTLSNQKRKGQGCELVVDNSMTDGELALDVLFHWQLMS